MRALLVVLLLTFTSAASARDLHLCVDANNWAPYTYPDHDGVLQRQVREAAARQGDGVTFLALPWLRCQSMVESGAVDGVLAVPATTAKRERFALPEVNGRVDEARAAGAAEVVLLRRADSEVSWDGRRLTGLQGRIGVVMGYDGIAARLDELGIPYSSDYHSDGQNMMALLADRTNVIAIYAQNAAALMDMPAYKGRIALLEPPLGRIHFYLGFNKGFYAREHDKVEALWSGLSKSRDAD